jgi:flagellar hook-basal body complex protein FliE
MALPAAAAAAYQAAAKMGVTAGPTAGVVTGDLSTPGPNFADFLSNAVKDSTETLKQGEQMAAKQVAGQANVVDVVNAVNAAEITLDTVVAVRDKVVQAYQAIMNMPI